MRSFYKNRLTICLFITVLFISTGIVFTSAAGVSSAASQRSISASKSLSTTAIASGKISLSASDTVIKKGDVFTVVCRVSASTGVSEADFYVDYNTSVLKFIEGGARATKEVGGVHIRSLDNDDAPLRRTFSLQFAGEQDGEASLFIRNGASVTDGEGNLISLQTDKIDVLINETGEDESADAQEGQSGDGSGSVAENPDGKPTTDKSSKTAEDPTAFSSNSRLMSVSTNAISLVPDFDPSVMTYEAEVDPDTETFITKYLTEDDRATVRIKGNKHLKFGRNRVKLIVTAENGRKSKYVFLVTKLAFMPEAEPEETEAPETVVSPAAVDVQVPLDKDDDKGYSIVLYVIIGLLAILSIALIALVKRQRRELDYIYEEMEEYRETQNDSGSGESAVEGGEVRSQDGEFGYRD